MNASKRGLYLNAGLNKVSLCNRRSEVPKTCRGSCKTQVQILTFEEMTKNERHGRSKFMQNQRLGMRPWHSGFDSTFHRGVLGSDPKKHHLHNFRNCIATTYYLFVIEL